MPKELHIAPYAGVYFYVFNTTKPPFNDKRVRTALSMAINREILVEKISAAGELPAYGFVPHRTPNSPSRREALPDLNTRQAVGAAHESLEHTPRPPHH